MKTLSHSRPSRLAVGASALVLAAAAVASAYAATSSRTRMGANTLGRGAIASAVTSELGISAAQLRTDLVGGQTLSEIASANGATASQLEQTILGVVQSRLAQAVSAGKLSSQQEQALLTQAGTVLDRLVTVSHPVARLARLRLRLRLLRFAATYIGVTPKELRSQIAAEGSLAQVLTSNGKSASGLEQSLVAAAKTRFDSGVAAGKISAAREQELLSRLQQGLARVLVQG
jgi:hypothetical protein